jgi:hypothetical protein
VRLTLLSPPPLPEPLRRVRPRRRAFPLRRHSVDSLAFAGEGFVGEFQVQQLQAPRDKPDG